MKTGCTCIGVHVAMCFDACQLRKHLVFARQLLDLLLLSSCKHPQHGRPLPRKLAEAGRSWPPKPEASKTASTAPAVSSISLIVQPMDIGENGKIEKWKWNNIIQIWKNGQQHGDLCKIQKGTSPSVTR